MNREIKFRAWDTRGKSWLYPYPEGFHLFGETTCFDLIRDQMHERYPGESSLLLMNEVEVVQYTGLKDKNGKPIYEGDMLSAICINNSITNAVVEFSDGSFIVSQIGGERLGDFLRDYNERHEVVGNVFENPELLEGK